MNEPSAGRVALVTGASSGIGAATALRLARAGCHVAVSYRNNSAGGEKVARECEALGIGALSVRGDVASDADCRSVVAEVTGRWGRLDFLINNAGMTRFAEARDMDALSAEDFSAIFGVNVTGAYQMTRASRAALAEAGGAVVNVSSHSGFSGIGSSIAYAASKGALNTLTKSLARALAPEIRVNAVCPGFVDTDWMAPKLGTEELVAFKGKAAGIAPLKRVPSADEVASAIAFLALDAPSVTGTLMIIDSGTHLTVGAPI